MNFMVLRRRAPIRGLWSLGGECLYELYDLCGVKGLFEFYGLDEENFFLSIYKGAFMRRPSLRGLWLHEEIVSTRKVLL